ncbi:MAG: methionine synthase [Kiritimatiellia bacterium]
MRLLERIRKGIFIMDGAMGTQIQNFEIPASAWQDKEGCNELLNLTAPDMIRQIHANYLAAGSDAVETNSFGSSPVTLGEYDLSSKAREISIAAARIAREAAAAASSPDRPRYVFGSVGPGTKLPTLGQIPYDQLRDGLTVQIEGLLEGGADGILLETCQDLLQIKAGVAAFEKAGGRKAGIPLYVSVTVEQTGTLLIGSSIAAVVATLSALPVDILGLNCATGPDAMRIHLDYLAANWPGLVACMPNAGMPELRNGQVNYPLQPAEFATLLAKMGREVGLNVAGGCCGTTPAHIEALCKELKGFCAPERKIAAPQQASSVFGPVDLSQEPPPLYIGERANATGSKKFRDALLKDDYDACFTILQEQEETGAHVLDLSMAYTGRDEVKDVQHLVGRAAKECRLPLMIDSTQTDVIEAALKLYGGRMIVNSINFESGEERARTVTELARVYGAALVGLTIDETGMAKTADEKFRVAERLVKFCEARGVPRTALFIDPLTFTVGSGDETLRTAAIETLAAIRRIKKELPGVRTVLGLSNISFGLKPAGRKVLNAVFLDRCVKAGMDACIINVAGIMPLTEISADALRVAEALLDNNHSAGDPLDNFINFFSDAQAEEASASAAAKEPEEILTDAVVRGRLQPLPDVMPGLLQKYAAEHILNEILVPAMKTVGCLFNDGILQLPFVLKSAEVMKKAVDLIKPHMKTSHSATRKAVMVLATVTGDVHDIGKNLVDIILSNNGFSVVNMGTKMPVEQMIAAVKEHKADVLGMSGLLVKSAAQMAENMKALEAAGLKIPVFLGGAALTAEYVANTCQPAYSGPVIYCKDAFEGLTRMQELVSKGKLERSAPVVRPPAEPVEIRTAPSEPVEKIAPPQPPFWGHRINRDINLDDVYPMLNEKSIVRGQWRFRKGKLSDLEWQKLMDEEVNPRLEELKKKFKNRNLFKPQTAWGFYPCRAEGNSLFVFPNEKAEPIRLEFPRQRRAPHKAIPDYFRADRDVVGFMSVTLGTGPDEETQRLLKEDRYQDYYLLYGFAVELTDALAEYCHKTMRIAWGFDEPELDLQGYNDQLYRGSRYGFGYASCPDLNMNRIACDLVHAKEMGVEVSENLMMIPEFTTAAIVLHHPQAKYFNV